MQIFLIGKYGRSKKLWGMHHDAKTHTHTQALYGHDYIIKRPHFRAKLLKLWPSMYNILSCNAISFVSKEGWNMWCVNTTWTERKKVQKQNFQVQQPHRDEQVNCATLNLKLHGLCKNIPCMNSAWSAVIRQDIWPSMRIHCHSDIVQK